MSNEELAVAIRAGERDKLMELWGQVRRLVHDMAYKRLRATNGAGGVTLDDLMQAGFLGFPEAVRAYDLTYPVKSAFSEAEGRRSEKQKRDPIFSAVSIDAPLDKGEGEPLTLADVIPDPHAAEALEGVGVWDTLHRAVNGLPEGQREEIRRRYWLNQTTAEISTATGTPEKEVRKLEAAGIPACHGCCGSIGKAVRKPGRPRDFRGPKRETNNERTERKAPNEA